MTIESIIQEDLSSPGTHALVIGISNYPYISGGEHATDLGESFDIGQLTSAARSASEFSAWLIEDYYNPDKPLKSLRVLLSPSDGEIIASNVQNKLTGDYSATRNNVKECAKALKTASKDSGNVIVVYVAGHGVQLTPKGAVLLLEDFASDVEEAEDKSLYGAFDVANFHASMNNENSSRSQFWFVDTCRHKPEIAERFEHMEGALRYEVRFGQTHSSPIFMAAAPRQAAYGRPGGVSLFNEALLWLLRSTGTTGRLTKENNWYVSFSVLLEFLPRRVYELARAEGEEQIVTIDGAINDALFHVFDEPPEVDLMLNLYPTEAAQRAPAKLTYKLNEVIFDNCRSWPMSVRVKAGIYTLKIEPESQFQEYEDRFPVEPPEFQITAELS